MHNSEESENTLCPFLQAYVTTVCMYLHEKGSVSAGEWIGTEFHGRVQIRPYRGRAPDLGCCWAGSISLPFSAGVVRCCAVLYGVAYAPVTGTIIKLLYRALD